MPKSLTRVALATLGSVAAIGGLVGAKALAADDTAAVDPAAGAPAPTRVDPPTRADPPGRAGGGPGRGDRGGRARPPAAAPSTTPSAPSVPPSASTPGTDGTFTGDAAPTRFGDVQVEIDVSSGRIDDIRVIAYPANDRKDLQINQRAIPILVSEALAAQSADVDTVSGATYTSQGYRQSLQSAIDKAGI